MLVALLQLGKQVGLRGQAVGGAAVAPAQVAADLAQAAHGGAGGDDQVAATLEAHNGVLKFGGLEISRRTKKCFLVIPWM